jgi:hypothetical protein
MILNLTQQNASSRSRSMSSTAATPTRRRVARTARCPQALSNELRAFAAQNRIS